jgi:spermidine synthase
MVAEGARGPFVWSRARIDDPRRSGWFYVDLFHLAAARARERRRALFLGCGGAVAVRQFAETYPGIRLDLVDVDPRVFDLAFAWYDLASVPHLTTHVADGAELVRRAPPEQWDVVIVDAYGDADLPPAFASRRFFRDVARVLRPGGAMALNAIGTLGGEGAVQAVERAARAALSDVRLVPVLDPGDACSPGAVRNVVVVGSRADR